MKVGVLVKTAITWSTLGSILAGTIVPAYGSDAPVVGLANGAVTLKPYVFNQFDLGSAWGAGKQTPTGGLNTRSLRYGVNVKLPNGFDARFIWDFGNIGIGWPEYRSTGLYEAAIHYTGLKPFTIVAGAFAPNLTLAGGQRPVDKLFATDPAIIGLVGTSSVNGGQLGIQISAHGSRWLLETALVGGDVGESSTSRERGLLARAAGLVVQTHDLAIHLGLSGAWSFRLPQKPDEQPGVDYTSTPEYDVQGLSTIQTGTISASSTFSAGPELGVAYGPLWMQGEYYRTLVDRTDGPNPSFSGWYVQAGWTLLGKPRQWRPSAGSWSAPRDGFDPGRGHWGALEIGARFSTADFNSRGINGGKQSIWTTGVNWWPLSPLRVSVQWQHTHVETGRGSDSFETALLRVQIFFH